MVQLGPVTPQESWEEWVSAGLRSVVLVDQDASVQAEVKLNPSGLRFTDPILLLVLELGEQAVGVLSFPSCSLCWLSFSSFLCWGHSRY